jgi:hypothetical protein
VRKIDIDLDDVEPIEAVAPTPPGFLPRRLGEWADLFAKVSAGLFIVFAVTEYWEAQRAARVARTQDFMSRYVTDPIYTARTTISAELRDNLESIGAIRSVELAPSAAEQAHKDLVQFLVYDSRNGAGLAAEVDALVDFFGMAAICVEQRLCDPAAARAYFAGDVDRLLNNFRPYVEERRRLAPDYAAAAERFASEGRDPQN